MITTTIAKNTFLEIITSPLLVILVVLGLVAVVILGIIPYFTLVLEDDVKMYKDVAVAMTLFIALILAVLSASKVIDEEIDNKTMMTLLSKPVLRGEILLGKFLGVCAAVAVVIVLCGLVIMVFAWWRPPWDRNVPMFSQGVQGFWAKLHDIFYPVGDYITKTRLKQWAHFWSVPPMMVLVFLQAAVMTAISVAISTRLGMAINVMLCAMVFIAGHMVSFLTLGGSWMKYLGVSALLTVIPQLEHFNITETLAYRTLGTDTAPFLAVWTYVGLAALCTFFYCAAALLVGLAIFRTRELA